MSHTMKDVYLWINNITGERCDELSHIQDGILFCKFINKIYPGKIPKISKVEDGDTKKKKKNFKKYLDVLKDFGVSSFTYRDVSIYFSQKTSKKIVKSFQDLSKHIKNEGSFQGPYIGEDYPLEKKKFVPKKKEKPKKKEVVDEKEYPEWKNMGGPLTLLDSKTQKIHKKKGMNFNRVKHNVIKNESEEKELYNKKYED